MNIDLLLKITTKIACKDGRKTIGTGTGFFFKDNNQLFLVTNRHVLIDEKTNYYPDKINIDLNVDPNDLTKSKTLSYELYEGNSDNKKWLEINENIDIAALPIDNPKSCILAALSSTNLPPSTLSMGLGEQVVVIGYPKGFYDDIHNLPIVRNASIASPYGIPFKKNPFFLIDSNLHPGTSGSPVITVPSIFSQSGNTFSIGNKKWHFLGINSGEFGGLGLNAIWYSRLVVDLVSKYKPKKK